MNSLTTAVIRKLKGTRPTRTSGSRASRANPTGSPATCRDLVAYSNVGARTTSRSRSEPSCAFVLVENAFVGRIKDLTRRSAGYRAFEDHDLCIALPPLDLVIADAIDDPAVSLSDIMSRPLSRSAQ